VAQATSIEWTDLSWNPTHGCSKVSPGCAHCYAETLSLRYKHTKKPWTPKNAGENVLLKPHKLREPLSTSKDWRGLGAAAAAAGKTEGKLVFVNSTSDLFHEKVPADYIARVFATMWVAHRHTFQVLTKRPGRMRSLCTSANFWRSVVNRASTVPGFAASDGPTALSPRDPWFLRNVWLGTSIENRRFVNRADLLRETPAAVRFISAEPLLGPLMVYEPPSDFEAPAWDWAKSLDLTDIDWLIVGGESGKGHRRFEWDWARDLRDACAATTARRFS
jgi:protein gp37